MARARGSPRPGGRAPRPLGPHRAAAALPPEWDDEEDYDSDESVALGIPLAQRARCKLLSAIHVGRVDVSDEDFEWPLDQDHDIETVDPTLKGFAEFLVELQEALVWYRLARGVQEDTIATLCHIYHTLSKQDAHVASGKRNIGRAAVREIRGVLQTYADVYKLDEHRAALDAVVRLRRVRTSTTEDRATRYTQTRRTTGAALVQQAEELLRMVDLALEQCGAQSA
jgi:hypothetical protein